jgi:hypothetical protein
MMIDDWNTVHSCDQVVEELIPFTNLDDILDTFLEGNSTPTSYAS